MSDPQQPNKAGKNKIVTDDPFILQDESQKDEAKANSQPVFPEDDIVAKNRKDFLKQIELLEKFKREMMQAYGVYVNLPFDIDFRRGVKGDENNLYPSVFLGKLITDTKTRIDNSAGQEIKIITNEYDHIQIDYYQYTFNKGDKEKEVTGSFIKVKNLLCPADLTGLSKDDCENSITEMIKGAFLAAQEAKAMHWTSVNFGQTQDPVKRYILQQVCRHDAIGLNCQNEFVPIDSLPKLDVFPAALNDVISALIEDYSTKIMTPIDKPQPKTQSAPQNQNNYQTAASMAAPGMHAA